jgi:AraC-like DNA-binding protein
VITYRESPPSPALRKYVECLWSMRSGDTASRSHDRPIERVLPDGCVELIVHLSDAFLRVLPDGRPHPQPRAFVVGPSTRPLLVQPGNHVDTLGVRFRPGGARPFLHVPLDELSDATTRLGDLLGSAGDHLPEALGAEETEAERVRILEGFLLPRLRAAGRGQPGLPAAVVRAALEHRGRLTATELSRRAGTGLRQLQRAFLSDLGLPPKSFLRLVRFQGLLAALPRSGAVNWAALAFECGYADQSHLIREFRSFAGETPSTLLRIEGHLSRHFTSPERLRAFFGTEETMSHSFYPAEDPSA